MEVRCRVRLLLDPDEKALAVPVVGLLTAPRHGAIHTTSAHGNNILQIDLKELYLLALVSTIIYSTYLSAGRFKHKNIPFL